MAKKTKNYISAEIIADSISPAGDRLTTFVLEFPRIILAEFNTHRVFSRNSASSRAIPFKTMLKNLKKKPFYPIAYMKEHSGMQGNDYFNPNAPMVGQLRQEWKKAMKLAILQATELSEMGLSKQICNRLLEPFLYHKVIVTATEYQNFFKLRAHEAAEIHIQDLAFKMKDAYEKSTPKLLNHNQWHTPFGDRIDEDRLKKTLEELGFEVNVFFMQKAKLEISIARCARVSYNNFEGTDDYKKDMELYERLSSMGHWSPFEHVALSVAGDNSGNFKGWRQVRKGFPGEDGINSTI